MMAATMPMMAAVERATVAMMGGAMQPSTERFVQVPQERNKFMNFEKDFFLKALGKELLVMIILKH
jgi:hypothetical protein